MHIARCINIVYLDGGQFNNKNCLLGEKTKKKYNLINLSCREKKTRVWDCIENAYAILTVSWAIISIKQCQIVTNRKGEVWTKREAMRKINIKILISKAIPVNRLALRG